MSWFDAEEHADRALQMYESGRWAEAEAELRKALALNPDQPEWHFNLGLTLEAASRDIEALVAYERSVALMPDQVEPLLAAGIVAGRVGQLDRALDYFRRALRIDPRCEAGYAHQIECLVALERHDEAETVFYLAQQTLQERSAPVLAAVAESLYRRELYGRAEWCLREALKLDPALPRVRARLGAVYAATGRTRKAVDMYIRDLRDDPGSIDTLLDYGEALEELQRLPEASEKYRRVLELEPANLEAHYRLGRIALAAGAWEQARLELELVLKLDPTFPRIREALGEALLRRGRVDEARGMLAQELRLHRLDDGSLSQCHDPGRLGALLLEAGLADQASAALESAVAREPRDAASWRRLALARFRVGDRRGGTAASRRALRLDRGSVVSMHNLALAALEGGRYRVAAAWIRRGLRTDRHDEGLRRLRVRLWLAWLRSKTPF
jgi:tetratricopeptide (TPR) repeat protein